MTTSFFQRKQKEDRTKRTSQLFDSLPTNCIVLYTQLGELLVTAHLTNTIHYYGLYWRRKFFQNKSLHVTCKRISLWTIPWQCKYSRPSNNWQKYLDHTRKEITSYFNLEVAITFPAKKKTNFQGIWYYRLHCKLALKAVPLKSLCCCQSNGSKTVLNVKTFSGT